MAFTMFMASKAPDLVPASAKRSTLTVLRISFKVRWGKVMSLFRSFHLEYREYFRRILFNRTLTLTPCRAASSCRTLSHSCLIRKVRVMVFLRATKRLDLLKTDQPLSKPLLNQYLCLISVLSLKIKSAEASNARSKHPK